MGKRGFTLIEMIVTLIILSIIGVFAAEKYLNFTRDSHQAKIEGAAAALASAMELVRTRIILDNAESSVDYEGETISLTAGMPQASAGSLRALLHIEVPSSWTRQWTSEPCAEPSYCILGNMFAGKNGFINVPGYIDSGSRGENRIAYLWSTGYTLNENGCFAYYINNASTGEVITGTVTEGC